MNRWPIRHGTALGIAVMLLITLGTITLLNRSQAAALPVGYAAEGMYVFEEHCGSCHGLYGEGSDRAPRLDGTGVSAGWDRATTADRIQEGIGSMPGVADLTRQDLADTVAYLRDLQTYDG